MLDHHRIYTRIEEMRRRVKLLKRDFQSLPEEKLTTDENLYAAAERHLEVAIQCCMDIGSHIIAQLGLERPKKENKEIFVILGKETVIPMDFAHTMAQMVGYRNILLVHSLVILGVNYFILGKRGG